MWPRAQPGPRERPRRACKRPCGRTALGASGPCKAAAGAPPHPLCHCCSPRAVQAGGLGAAGVRERSLVGGDVIAEAGGGTAGLQAQYQVGRQCCAAPICAGGPADGPRACSRKSTPLGQGRQQSRYAGARKPGAPCGPQGGTGRLNCQQRASAACGRPAAAPPPLTARRKGTGGRAAAAQAQRPDRRQAHPQLCVMRQGKRGEAMRLPLAPPVVMHPAAARRHSLRGASHALLSASTCETRSKTP